MTELSVSFSLLGFCIGMGLYYGLAAIADAIRNRNINITLGSPIEVNHRHQVDK